MSAGDVAARVVVILAVAAGAAVLAYLALSGRTPRRRTNHPK